MNGTNTCKQAIELYRNRAINSIHDSIGLTVFSRNCWTKDSFKH